MVQKNLILILSFLLVIVLGSGIVLGETTTSCKGRNISSLKKQNDFDSRILSPNNIAIWLSNYGIFGDDLTTGTGGCYFPSGQTEKSVICSAGLWIVGYINNDLRSAAAYYATEFQPGMILPDGNPGEPADSSFKIFLLNKEDPVPQQMIDQGGPYKVIGDQMAYCVYNDYGDHFGIWCKAPIGLEVHQLFWGYNDPGPLGNAIFMKFTLLNKAPDTLKAAYVGIWSDPDLGQADDDYAGCDTLREMGFTYNGDDEDDVYGPTPPCMGFSQLQGPIVSSPGDTARLPDGRTFNDSTVLSMKSFSLFLCGGPEGMCGPHLQTSQGAQEAYWYFQGLKGNGQPWLDPTNENKATPFPFSGDPVTGSGWIVSSFTSPRDVYMLQGTGPFDLVPGKSQEVLFALVIGQGTDYLSSITAARDIADTVKAFYKTKWDSLSTAFKKPIPREWMLFQNFPNPFNLTTTIYFGVQKRSNVKIVIYNMRGKSIREIVNAEYEPGFYNVKWNGTNSSGIPVSSGVYLYHMISKEGTATKKMLLVR